MSSQEFDQYWNGAAWQSYAPNRVPDDLDDIDRLDAMEQHERIISEAKPFMSPGMSELDTANLEIELASFEALKWSENNTERVIYYADWVLDRWKASFSTSSEDSEAKLHEEYDQNWHEEDNAYIDYDSLADPDGSASIEVVSFDDIDDLYLQVYGEFQYSSDYPEEDERYEHPGLSLGMDMDDLIDEAASRYAESRSFYEDYDP